MSPPRPESEAELKKIEKNERRRKSYKAKREASSYQKIKDEIPEIPGWLMSNQLGKQLEASDKFTMLVEKGEISVIDEVINQGGVPVLVEFLATGDTAELRLIAAQSLANIARGNLVQTQVIIDQNGIPPLVYRLGTGNDEIREMAICALSNISYHSTHTREAVIDSGAFLELWKLLKQPFEPRLTILTKASLALANFCRGEPPNKTVFNQIRQNMPVLKQLLLMTDKQVATNACTTFSLIASKADMIQAVDEAQICARMIELIKKPMPECFEPALLTLAEIAAQNHVSAQAVISAGLVFALVNSTRAESDFRKDAAQAILNITNNGSPEQILSLVNDGCIPPLCALLTCADPMTVCICLNGLRNILRADQARKGMVEECGGMEKIAVLQHNENTDARDIAVEILEGFWPEKIDWDHYLN
ncbi:hypothetical protein KIW84_030705 [Lathyrus oleraceus]|uniref:Importin subunit alpha n=1 Tax=Pisum sativum TaxID=3888 RepID=A0A9D4XQD4_PEA|nr:hypothetical protein KIW84_030690 [Pisum sativum]KAI5424611.1 hypothetical protein KIW84_030697 [Pisum sativum]KAI5424619.1 hypothetical protein KIW84_030705 [Pisum sativum]